MKRFLALSFFFALALSSYAHSDNLPDNTSPRIYWEVVQPGILAVTAEDSGSMPARMEVSLDGGQTWQAMDYPVSWAQPSTRVPSVTWNVELQPGVNRVAVRAIDGAGNGTYATGSVQDGARSYGR